MCCRIERTLEYFSRDKKYKLADRNFGTGTNFLEQENLSQKEGISCFKKKVLALGLFS